MTDAPKPLWPVGLTLLCSVFGALGQAFFKGASEKVGLTDPMSWIANWKLLVGLSFYGLATVLFVFALKYGQLSALYPVIAMSYVWVLLIACFYFQEKINVMNWVGVALIVLGVALTAGGRGA